MRSLAFLLLFIATSANAGPWLREDGSVFLSFGANMFLSDGAQLPVNQDPFLYVEWGVTQKTTLSFNLFSGDAGQERTAEVFAIRNVALPEKWGKVSYSLGVGYREVVNQDPSTLIGSGLSWGMGLENGWVTIEAQTMSNVETFTTEAKIGLTVGRQFSDRLSGMLLLQAGRGHTGSDYAKLSPSVIYQVNDNWRVNAGVNHALTGDRGTGLFLSGWLEY